MFRSIARWWHFLGDKRQHGRLVVGEYFDASEVVHGFTELRGVFTPVEDPAGAEGTDLTGISNLGVVVGFYIDSSGNTHGFELTPAH